jgi:hypothetical protein
MRLPRIQHFGLVLALSLTACAAVQHSPAQLHPLAASAEPALHVLAQETRLTLDTGYTRTLKAGSRWRSAGTVDQGDVYRPVGDVFTLEGAHIHEAWLVVRGESLVGFYLPAEHGYSPLSTAVPLHFTHS